MGTGASREKVFKGGNSREGGRLLKRGLIERKKCLTPFFFFLIIPAWSKWLRMAFFVAGSIQQSPGGDGVEVTLVKD